MTTVLSEFVTALASYPIWACGKCGKLATFVYCAFGGTGMVYCRACWQHEMYQKDKRRGMLVETTMEPTDEMTSLPRLNLGQKVWILRWSEAPQRGWRVVGPVTIRVVRDIREHVRLGELPVYNELHNISYSCEETDDSGYVYCARQEECFATYEEAQIEMVKRQQP